MEFEEVQHKSANDLQKEYNTALLLKKKTNPIKLIRESGVGERKRNKIKVNSSPINHHEFGKNESSSNGYDFMIDDTFNDYRNDVTRNVDNNRDKIKKAVSNSYKNGNITSSDITPRITDSVEYS